MSVDQTASRTRAVIAALIEVAGEVNARNKIALSNRRGKQTAQSVASVPRARIAPHGQNAQNALIKSRAKLVHVKIGHAKIGGAAHRSNDAIGLMIGPTTGRMIGRMIVTVARNGVIATRPRASPQPALLTTCQPSCVRQRGPKRRTNKPAL